ncbi:hypothetical protein HMPREF0004_0088 [Achromobacter piechaudii ATCC 43553]|uniref:Uncharacterized protein n=1 Tax=Achromobacter piechaudii ATCC 43553 TaxID=742159 RepID=D4X3P1_9BURK|nr:hypothetical protein HMPREF0004_0088 [Achromobacter piechaudii ATCC 43553]
MTIWESTCLLPPTSAAMGYRKITWTHEIAGTEASDDWRKPLES